MENWISQLYKSKGDFGQNRRDNRRNAADQIRQCARNSQLIQLRNIPTNMSPLNSPRIGELPEPEPIKTKSKRLEKLEKWKAEKEKKKLEAQKIKKPIFKVCHIKPNDSLENVYKYIKGKSIPGKDRKPVKGINDNEHQSQLPSTNPAKEIGKLPSKQVKIDSIQTKNSKTQNLINSKTKPSNKNEDVKKITPQIEKGKFVRLKSVSPKAIRKSNNSHKMKASNKVKTSSSVTASRPSRSAVISTTSEKKSETKPQGLSRENSSSEVASFSTKRRERRSLSEGARVIQSVTEKIDTLKSKQDDLKNSRKTGEIPKGKLSSYSQKPRRQTAVVGPQKASQPSDTSGRSKRNTPIRNSTANNFTSDERLENNSDSFLLRTCVVNLNRRDVDGNKSFGVRMNVVNVPVREQLHTLNNISSVENNDSEDRLQPSSSRSSLTNKSRTPAIKLRSSRSSRTIQEKDDDEAQIVDQTGSANIDLIFEKGNQRSFSNITSETNEDLLGQSTSRNSFVKISRTPMENLKLCSRRSRKIQNEVGDAEEIVDLTESSNIVENDQIERGNRRSSSNITAKTNENSNEAVSLESLRNTPRENIDHENLLGQSTFRNSFVKTSGTPTEKLKMSSRRSRKIHNEVHDAEDIEDQTESPHIIKNDNIFERGNRRSSSNITSEMNGNRNIDHEDLLGQSPSRNSLLKSSRTPTEKFRLSNRRSRKVQDEVDGADEIEDQTESSNEVQNDQIFEKRNQGRNLNTTLETDGNQNVSLSVKSDKIQNQPSSSRRSLIKKSKTPMDASLNNSRTSRNAARTPRSSRRSSRRTLNVAEDAKVEEPKTLEIQNNTEDLDQPSTSRKSIMNTRKTEWKLVFNDSFKQTQTPNKSRKSSSSKVSVKSTVSTEESQVDSDEFVSPLKNDEDVALNNTVFFTPGKESVKKNEDDEPVVYVSPFVTISRGKSAARKEYEQRKSVDAMNSSMSNPNDPKSPRAAAAYFTRMLNKEIQRIEDMCDVWQSYKEKENLSDDACGVIDMAIGQSNLLITKKFKQFRGLIEKCQNNSDSEMKVQCEDLHGFWDMIYKQVTDLDNRFKYLEEMKENNWLEKAPKKSSPKKRGRPVKKRGDTMSAPSASSLLKEAIKAGRKRKVCQQQSLDSVVMFGVSNKNSPSVSNLSNARKSLSMSQAEFSTPGRGILKSDNSKSEQRKTVVFTGLRNSIGNGKENTISSGRKGTPLPVRRSGRISFGRYKLDFN